MLKKIKLIGNSDVKLSSSEMRELSGGNYGCGCCVCTPSYSATGAGTITAQVAGPVVTTPVPIITTSPEVTTT